MLQAKVTATNDRQVAVQARGHGMEAVAKTSQIANLHAPKLSSTATLRSTQHMTTNSSLGLPTTRFGRLEIVYASPQHTTTTGLSSAATRRGSRASLPRIEKGNAIRISNIPAIEIIRTSYRSQEDLATKFWGFGIGPLRHLWFFELCDRAVKEFEDLS